MSVSQSVLTLISFVLVSLSYKLAQNLDAEHLEFAFQAALLDKRFYLAALAIQACYRGMRTRRELKETLERRKRAVWTLQFFIKKRISAFRLKLA